MSFVLTFGATTTMTYTDHSTIQARIRYLEELERRLANTTTTLKRTFEHLTQTSTKESTNDRK